METRSPSKNSASRRNGDSTPKTNAFKQSNEEYALKSMPKRARPYDDDYVNPRLRSAKNFSNTIQGTFHNSFNRNLWPIIDRNQVTQQLKNLQAFAQNILVVPPVLKKSKSKSARTSREPSPTRPTTTIQLLQVLPTKLQRTESKSCPGSPTGRNHKITKDMIEEEEEYSKESLRMFLYPNSRVKVFWTLPIIKIANNLQKKFEVTFNA